jgi:hypothetical protein
MSTLKAPFAPQDHQSGELVAATDEKDPAG